MKRVLALMLILGCGLVSMGCTDPGPTGPQFWIGGDNNQLDYYAPEVQGDNEGDLGQDNEAPVVVVTEVQEGE